ncbi:GNAT family N-acetyltransferase (plasmid) [Haloferax sp. S1W]|uniref:GNAT family N-acetyltransferase n=1 Tax=Haloferax sp. S1W TaxID=3377110 RepID=UPI0037C525F1
MSVEITRASDTALDGLDGTWDDLVEQSPMGSLFHRYDVLRVIEAHSGATLHPLVGYKGQEPVGVFPVYEISKGPVTTAFSPPPGMGIPNLGPVLFNYQKLKQRRFEKRNLAFVEGCVSWMEENLDPKYSHVVTQASYNDVRPFQWNEFTVTPKYTYDIDLSLGEATLLDGFTRDARTSIQNTPDDAYVIEERGFEGIDYVLERINSRYDKGGGGLVLKPQYIKDLYDTLPDGSLRVYVAEVDGQPVSGRLTLHSADGVTLWQGSPKPDIDIDVPINDLLNWRSMVDGIAAGKSTCNFVGANTRHLCRYKAKFNPKTNLYFEIERGTRTMSVVSDLYRRFR